MTFAAYQPFDLPVDPPNSEPDEGPFLQPAYNAEWNKYVLGVVAALLDPNAYTGDEAAKALATDRAQNLMSIFANAPGIVQFRQVDCTLEYSLDNGDTWTAIFEECPSDLTDGIIKAPASGTRNTITPTTAGLDGLHIVTTGAKAIEAAQAYNPSGPHSFPAVQIESDDGPTLLLANGNVKGLIVRSGGTIVDYLARLYLPQTGDPTPSADTHGAMYRHSNGDGTEEPRIILQLADTSYASVSLKGADGAPGTNGTNGTNGADGQDGAGITVVTFIEGTATSDPSATLTNSPDIQHQQLDLSIPAPGIVTEVTAEALASTEAPTVSVSTRTDGDLKLAFGIPAGTPGATGGLTFPARPNYGDDPVTFPLIIIGHGTSLPWILPAGYRVQLSEFMGMWAALDSGQTYHTSAFGSNSHNESSGIPTGRAVFYQYTVDSGGADQGHVGPSDGTAEYTMSADGVLSIECNAQLAASALGYVICQCTVTAPATGYNQDCVTADYWHDGNSTINKGSWEWDADNAEWHVTQEYDTSSGYTYHTASQSWTLSGSNHIDNVSATIRRLVGHAYNSEMYVAWNDASGGHSHFMGNTNYATSPGLTQQLSYALNADNVTSITVTLYTGTSGSEQTTTIDAFIATTFC